MSYRDFWELARLFCYISLPWGAVERIPGARHLGASEQHILLHLGSLSPPSDLVSLDQTMHGDLPSG